MTTLLSLPNETLLAILLKSSVSTILTLSQVSKTFYDLVKDDLTWKLLVKRDFRVESLELIEESWKEEYLYHFRQEAGLWLTKAVRTNDIYFIKYILFYGARSFGPALKTAASIGSYQIIKILIDVMKERSLLPNYNGILKELARKGHTSLLIELIGDIRSYYPKLYDILKFDIIVHVAAQMGNIETIEEICKIDNRILDNHLNWIVRGAAHGGHFQIISKMEPKIRSLDESTRRSLGRSILVLALRRGDYRIVKQIIKDITKENFRLYWKSIIESLMIGGNQRCYTLISNVMTINGLKLDYGEVIFLATKYSHPVFFQLAVGELEAQNIQPKYNDLLREAVIGGCVEIVKLILQKNYWRTREEMTSNLLTTLSVAISHYDLISGIFKTRVKMVKFLLSFINKSNIIIDHNLSLTMALKGGNLAVFQIIFKDAEIHRIVPNYEFLIRETLSDKTTRYRSSGCLIFLLRYLIDNKIKFQSNQGLLNLVVKRGDLKLLKSMIEGIGVWYQELLDSALSYRHPKIVNYILGRIKRENIYIDYLQSLRNAVNSESLAMVKIIWTLLQNNGTEVAKVFDYIFDYICLNKNEKIFEFFLDLVRKYKVSLGYSQCMTSAIRARNIRIMRSLLRSIPKMAEDFNLYFNTAVRTGDCQLVRLIHTEILRLGIKIDYKEAQETLLEEEKRTEGSKDYSQMIDILNIWVNSHESVT